MENPRTAPDLRYVSDAAPGIRRRRRGRGFAYMHPNGRPVRDERVVHRIRALAIPPAWTDVWICPDPRGHIQATGRDRLGRKQYRYHAAWSEARGEAKYAALLRFAAALPRLRRRIARDLKREALDRQRITAAAVRLLDTTHIRVGNREYTRRSGARGLTTLREEHVRLNGDCVALHYRAKGGQLRRLHTCDRSLARAMRRCQDVAGQTLFQYRDADGELVALTSTDVNTYIGEAGGGDFTAKDFRTWAGTVLAVGALRRRVHGGRRSVRALNAALDEVARHLGNTRAVCRKYYVHPAITAAYLDGRLADALERGAAVRTPARLLAEERLAFGVLRVLGHRAR